MEEKFKDLIYMCKNGIALNSGNIGKGRILVERKTFQLVIPTDNTDSHGDFFVYSFQGHDCYSYNSESTHIYHIIDGRGKFIIGDEPVEVKSGDTIVIEPNKVFTYEGNMIITFEMIPNFKEENNHVVNKVDYSCIKK